MILIIIQVKWYQGLYVQFWMQCNKYNHNIIYYKLHIFWFNQELINLLMCLLLLIWKNSQKLMIKRQSIVKICGILCLVKKKFNILFQLYLNGFKKELNDHLFWKYTNFISYLYVSQVQKKDIWKVSIDERKKLYKKIICLTF